jgi:hypothetical protein
MISRENHFLILNLLGIVFLILGIGAIANSLYIENPSQIFWMCYLSLILIGFGILTRNSFLIVVQLNILAIPFIIWDVDFIYWIIFNRPLWGITDYFFLERTFTLGKIISLQHLFTVPISLLAVYLIKLKRKNSWVFSVIQISLVYLAVSLFTPKESNINCVFDPCINVHFGISYRLTWFIIFFLMIMATSYCINRIPIFLNRQN